MVGSGPYKLVSYQSEQGAYKMVRFDEFWGLKPAVAAIEWIPVSDNILAFNNKEIDITNLPADLVKNYENNSEFKVVKNFGLHDFRFYFNFDKIPAFRDKEVRQAIAYAIDRNELIEKLERGSGLEGSQGYLHPAHPMYNPNLPKYEFNPEKAKELMKGRTITAQLTVGSSPKEVKIVEAGGMGGDADMLREIYSSKTKKPHLAGYANAQLDDLLYRQSIERNAETRKQLIYSIQEILADEIPMLLLYGKIDNTVYRPAKYDRWTVRYDHAKLDHPKLSYIIRP